MSQQERTQRPAMLVELDLNDVMVLVKQPGGTVSVDWPWFFRYSDDDKIIGSTEYFGAGSYPDWVEAAMQVVGIDPNQDYAVDPPTFDEPDE